MTLAGRTMGGPVGEITMLKELVRVNDAVHRTALAQGRAVDFRHSRVVASIGRAALLFISTPSMCSVSSLVSLRSPRHFRLVGRRRHGRSLVVDCCYLLFHSSV
jgi:hypothetical protein